MGGRNLTVRIYLSSRKCLRKITTAAHAGFNGLWLGLMSKDTLHGIDEMYYDANKGMYCNEEYNRRGLFAWEREVVDNFFADRSSVLVAAVGGGREVLALRRLGFDADGFECHPGLVSFANELLEKEGLTPDVRCVPRDQFPEDGRSYDGLIVGWGAYMLIQGRRNRVNFLKGLRAKVGDGAPLVVSFFHRASDQALHLKIVRSSGNFFRSLLRREPLEYGDDLVPDFVHYFSREELAAELAEAGFAMVYYSKKDYGHAVGIAAGATRVAQGVVSEKEVAGLPHGLPRELDARAARTGAGDGGQRTGGVAAAACERV